jgi:hypothetical protein
LSLVVQNYIDYSTAIGEEPNTRGRRGALSSYHKTRIISPIPQLKGLDTQHNTTLAFEGRRIHCHVYSAENKDTRM